MLDLGSNDRSRPVHRGREVKPGAGLQLPPPSHGDCHECTKRRHDMRGGQANHSGNLPPDRAAQGQATKERGDKDRKSTAAHPVRQRDLGGDIEACQDRDPGCPRNNASRQSGWRIASQREQDHRQGCAKRSNCHKAIGSEFRFQPGQSQSGAHRCGTDRPKEVAVQVWAAGDLSARDQWKERPIGAREQEEGRRSD